MSILLLVLIMSLLARVSSEDVVALKTCFGHSVASVEFRSIAVADDYQYTRAYVNPNCFSPTVARNFSSNNIGDCSQSIFAARLNSFSYEDGLCVGYSWWHPTPSVLSSETARDDAALLYVGDYQLTEYGENAVAFENPQIVDVFWTGAADISVHDRGEISFELLGAICMVDSVDLYYDGVLQDSWNATGPKMKLPTDGSLCRARSAYFGINVGGTMREKHQLKTTEDSNRAYNIQNYRFTDQEAGSKDFSTFKFEVGGPYETLAEVYVENTVRSQSPIIEILPGGHSNYTLLYYPPSKICYLDPSLYDVNYLIRLRDRFRCTKDEIYPRRNLCPRLFDGDFIDFCSFCMLAAAETLEYGAGLHYCSHFGSYSYMELIPKVDSQQVLRAIRHETGFTENSTAWVQYTLVEGVWQWLDGTTDVDTELLNMEEFNNQPDSDGECSAVKLQDNQFKLLKVDCMHGVRWSFCVFPTDRP